MHNIIDKAMELLGTIDILQWFLTWLILLLLLLIRERMKGIVTGEKAVKTVKERMISSLFLAYLAFVFQLTLGSRGEDALTGVKLHGILLFRPEVAPIEKIYELLNIVLFVPIGMGLVWINREKKRLYQFFLLVAEAFLLSFSIEIVQLMTQRGIFEVADMLTNTIGAIIGGAVIGAVHHGMHKKHMQ